MANERDRRLITNHQAMMESVTARIQRWALDRFYALPNYRDDDMERFVAEVVGVVESGQKSISKLTNSHLDALARRAGMTPSPAVKPQYDVRQGTTTAEVYARPFATVHYELSKGSSMTAAVATAGQRLQTLVATDMQLAQARTAHLRMRGDSRVVGWQRVLGGGESCPLCAIASTQRYRRSDLMPIHQNCRCSVAAIYGDSDPGQVINAERLASVQSQLKDQGFEYTAGAFKTDRQIRVRTNGELGPLLTWSDQSFRSAADI